MIKTENYLFNELRRRIRIRRKQEAFHPNATQLTLHFGSSIFTFGESINRKQCIFPINNISDKSQKISLHEINLIGTESWTDLLTDKKFTANDNSITLEPYQSLWISNESRSS